MDRTKEFEAFNPDRGPPQPKRYTPLDDTTSLMTKIIKMKSHLSKYGHDYLNTYGVLPGASIMNDERRDKLDQDVEEFIKMCIDKLKLFEAETIQLNSLNQANDHWKTAIEIMRRILRDLMNHYDLLRTTRRQRSFEKLKFDRIESRTGHVSPTPYDCESITSEAFSLDSLESTLASDNKSISSAETRTNMSSISFEDCKSQSLMAAEHHTSISPEEILVLAVENSQMHDELLTLEDEIKVIGKKVVQLSKLQELFTEKVLEQELELNNLHETAIKSSENVREGNDLIRDAMMKNASTRVFILFYIITLGFTILFLDWYNP